MSKELILKLDTIVRSTLSPIINIGSLSLKKMSINDVLSIDSYVGEKLLLRIQHFTKNISSGLPTKDAHYSAIINSTLRILEKKATGKEIKLVSPPTESELVKYGKNLLPFLATSISKLELDIKGYADQSGSNMWFACSKTFKNGFHFIDHHGEIRQANENKLAGIGFTKIAGDQSGLISKCRAYVSGLAEGAEIMKFGIYTSQEMLPNASYNHSKRLLVDFVNKLPEQSPAQKPENREALRM